MQNKKFNLKLNKKINSFNKTIKVDSDKSMSIRGFIIGSISQNISSITNVLESEDVLTSINTLKILLIQMENQESQQASLKDHEPLLIENL